MDWNRREFIVAPAAAIATSLCAADPPAPWQRKIRRIGQTNMTEHDPAVLDVEQWADYWASLKVDAVLISVTGILAFYPTKVPFHHRSQWLGASDPFGDLVQGCRKLGMVVIARTDPHATYDDVKAAHPDWIAVDASGKPRRHWASPEMWVTCGYGPYNFDFMTEVKKELMNRYHMDGFFVNRYGSESGPGLFTVSDNVDGCWPDVIGSATRPS